MIKKLDTETAYLWWAIGIVLATVAKVIFPAVPYVEFIGTWTVGFLGVGVKRTVEKLENFNGGSGSK